MDAGPEIAAIDASSAASLCGALLERSPGGHYLVADLSLGGWRPHELAHQALEQLGEPLATAPVAGGSRPAVDQALSCARIIGASIDLEARGDAAVLSAHRHATAIAAGCQRFGGSGLLVLVPRRGASWERQDRLAAEALAAALPAGGQELLLGVTADIAQLPSHWRVELPSLQAPPPPPLDDVLALLPTTIGPAVAAQLDLGALAPSVRTLQLPGRVRLVAPECRRPATATPAAPYERLIAVSRGWLRAYAQHGARNAFVEPELLAKIAWESFQDGGAEIALRLLERAAACAPERGDRAGLEVQAQGVRIASGHFAEAAAAAPPAPGAPPRLRRLQLEMIGWGLAMSPRREDAERARALLEEAAELLEPREDRREALYLRNILALATLKAGDAQRALVIEESIRAAAAELAEPDWRLACVNALNLARLQRRLGAFDVAEDHYRRAFETSAGVRPRPEAVYANATLARVAEDRGDAAAARERWLRAALHWLALELPEAFPRRFAALFGAAAADPAARAGAVAAGLEARLAGLSAGTCGWDRRLPAFRRPCEETPPERAVGAPGWGVLLSRVDRGPRPPAANESLGRRVLGLLAAADPDAGWEDAATVIVDPRHGCELPTTRAELLDAALEHDAPVVRWLGHEAALDQHERRELAQRQRVRLGPAVLACAPEADSVVVSFRRQRLPINLNGQRAATVATVAAAQEPAPLRLGGLVEQTEASRQLLSDLRHRRILTLQLGEDACTQAGIWSGTSDRSLSR